MHEAYVWRYYNLKTYFLDLYLRTFGKLSCCFFVILRHFRRFTVILVLHCDQTFYFNNSNALSPWGINLSNMKFTKSCGFTHVPWLCVRFLCAFLRLSLMKNVLQWSGLTQVGNKLNKVLFLFCMFVLLNVFLTVFIMQNNSIWRLKTKINI